jgi:hypothetical protein
MMDFYPDRENSKWAEARDAAADRNRFLLKTVPILMGNGRSVSDAVYLATEAYAAIEAVARRDMEAIHHLKEQK